MARRVRKTTRKKASKKTAAKRMEKERRALRRDGIPRSFLGREAQRQIDRFGLSRDLAAVVVGDAASQMSRLMTGHLAEFSADRLAKMLMKLGSDITITIHHAKRLGRRGRVRMKVE